jgi:hypothetical protein
MVFMGYILRYAMLGICYRKRMVWFARSLAQGMFKVGGERCVGKKMCDGARGILPAIERKDRGTPSVLCSLSLFAACARKAPLL